MLADIQDAIRSRPPRTRLVFLSDYDGTLADFDPDPTVPMLTPRRRDLLSALVRRPDLSIGLVSGRRIVDLRTRTQLPPSAYLAGLHGMEIEVDGRHWQHPDLEKARIHVRRLAIELEETRHRIPGLYIEDKDVAIAAHVRRVEPEQRDDAIELVEACAAPWILSGHLRRLEGALVVEYLPNVAFHKGDATIWIQTDVELRMGTRCFLVFVGDDITDEDAFRAIRTRNSGIGVLVGSRPSAAAHQLSSTEEVEELIAWVAATS